MILIGAAPAGSLPFADLARHMTRGSTVVFLDPHVFAKGNDAVSNLPLIHKGNLSDIVGWLYLKDEWSKKHPIFEGLPTGGLMDYTFYREIIPDTVFTGQEPPAEAIAGAIKASQDYFSGLMVAQYPFGAGQFILNTLRIRETLGPHPAAECLLRNMLNFAAQSGDQPIVDLPKNFDAQLKAMGYGGKE